MAQFTTGEKSTFDTAKPCKCSLSVFTPNKELQYFPVITLTGRFYDHKDGNGRIWSEVEAFDQYGEGGFINTDFIYQ